MGHSKYYPTLKQMIDQVNGLGYTVRFKRCKFKDPAYISFFDNEITPNQIKFDTPCPFGPQEKSKGYVAVELKKGNAIRIVDHSICSAKDPFHGDLGSIKALGRAISKIQKIERVGKHVS